MKKIVQIKNINIILQLLQDNKTVYVFDLFTIRTRPIDGKQLTSVHHYLQNTYNDGLQTENNYLQNTCEHSYLQTDVDDYYEKEYDLDPAFINQLKLDFESGRYLYFILSSEE